jgi:hypothetical protein
MTTIADVIKRDLGVKVEGVVKVYDEAALAGELREYVLTDRIELELRRILDTFTLTSQALRRGGASRDVMGIWLSGFFGSGKSHFAKVLGHLLQNEVLDESGTRCIDEFVHHLSDSQDGQKVRERLGEVKLGTSVRTMAFEIRSRQSLTNPSSVGEILLAEFYRHIGLAENFVVARLERRLQERGRLELLARAYEQAFNEPWAEGRNDLLTVRRRLEQVLPEVEPDDLPDRDAAKRAVSDLFDLSSLTPEGVAEELVAWVDAQPRNDGRVNHLVFVIDEMGTFISDSADKIGELNSLAEQLGNKGKGKVWLIATSQQDLESVVDRTNFQPALVGRLNARFELKPHLVTDGIDRIVSERILKKKPAQESGLRALYAEHEGQLAQLADLKATRVLGKLDERSFVDCYPLMAPQVKLAQDVFEALAGFRISGGVRSMVSVTMDVLQAIADDDLGTLVSFDQVFDAIEQDLLSQEYLGAAGVRSIAGATQAVPETPLDAARVVKVLWMLGRVKWVPRVPETLAKLLARKVDQDLPKQRAEVEETLEALQQAGYVALDESSSEWKYLNEQERTIEQAIQEHVRPGGTKSIGVAALRRTAQQLCRDHLVTKSRLSNFAVLHGDSRAPFSFGVHLDGEVIESGRELDVKFVSPLAPGRGEELEQIRAENQANGPRGRTVWWMAHSDERLEGRLRRHEALLKVTADRRFVEDSAQATQDALAERRRERDELARALVRDLERAFLAGTLFYGGQEVELESPADMSEPVSRALASAIPNVFPRFRAADRSIDFQRAVKALLNPATTQLDAVGPELGLFDTQGSLQREAALVAPVLEALGDLRDEGVEAVGSKLLDAGDGAGFRGFERRPFGWPNELVRLVLAACLRAGAVYLERQSPTGPRAIYDFRDTDDDFLKITAFKRLTFRVAQTTLSVAQRRAAGQALIGLGVTGVPESGNALAGALKELGDSLAAGVAEAERLAGSGLPISSEVLSAGELLAAPLDANDPTTTVTEFLKVSASWSALRDRLAAIRAFVSAGRPREFELHQRVAAQARRDPISPSDPGKDSLGQTLADMDAIVADRSVIERWTDFSAAGREAYSAYRAAYLRAYSEICAAIEGSLDDLRADAAYLSAPANERDAVIQRTFGPGGAMHYPELLVQSAAELLEATARRPLGAFEQALMALPGARARVLADLRTLTAPMPGPEQRVHQWSASVALGGRRMTSESEVDAALAEVADDLKGKIRDGYVVEVR